MFTRTGAGVELSAYGSALYGRAVRILPALDEARDEIDHLRGRAKAVIRIATVDLWGLVILTRIIHEFSKIHPDVLVEVKIADDGCTSRLQTQGLGFCATIESIRFSMADESPSPHDIEDSNAVDCRVAAGCTDCRRHFSQPSGVRQRGNSSLEPEEISKTRKHLRAF